MNTIKLEPSLIESMKFKKIFHGNQKTAFLAIKKSETGEPVKSIELYGSLKNNWERISKLNKNGWDVFMTINALTSSKRKGENIGNINSLFIDYDNGDWSADDIVSFMGKFPIEPRLVTESSPGCFHVYWLVDDMPLAEFKSAQKKLAAKYNADPKVCDLARVMRLPGTVNWKREEKFLVRTVLSNDKAQKLPFVEFCSRMFTPLNSTNSDKRNVEVSNLTADVISALEKIPANDRSIWVTGGMALKNEFGEAGLAMFKDWSAKSPKYDEAETERQWNSFKRGGGITIKTLFWLAKQSSAIPNISEIREETPTNFLSLAKFFSTASRNRLRHCEESNSWYVAKYSKWYPSNKAAARVAIDFLQAMNIVAQQSTSDTFRNFIERHQSPGSARELLKAAESDPLLSINSNSFVQDANVLSVRLPEVSEAIQRHAIIYLDTGKRKLASPSDMVLRVAGAPYIPKAKATRWNEFINQITVGDTDLADFLQLAVGYTLYGHTNEQVLFILIGTGGNGKGVFSHILHKVVGDYAAVIQSNLLKPGAISANNPSPALMALMSKRLWTCSEVPKGMILDESLTKQITGGDLLSTRPLYGGQIEYEPIGKLWLSVNNMPRVRHDDQGMWRRIIPIPFKAVFTGNARDNDLEKKLEEELPGILNWALEGAKKFATKGKLGRPNASKLLLSELRRDVDTVGLWVETRCLVTDEGTLQSKVAYEDYCETMKRERTNPLPQKEFNADLKARGFAHKTSRKFNFFAGLTLRPEQ